MSRRSCVSFAALGWLLAWTHASAQTSAPGSPQLPRLDRPAEYAGPPLSLNAAIEEALTNNPSLLVLQREVEVARQRPPQETSLAPPTFTAQVWQWPVNTWNPSNANMFMFMIEQDIPGRGKRSLRAAAAAKDIDIAANDVTVTAQQTLNDLKHAYVTLLTARKITEIYGESASILRQLADAAEVKYAAGRISQQDVLKPAAELSTLYDEALVSRQEADLATAQLNALMGRPIDRPIGPLEDITPAMPITEFSALIDLALRRHPELQSARLTIEKAKADRAIAKSESAPDYSVQGGYMLTPRGTDAWTGQIAISWPSAPWARGRLDAHITEADAGLRVAEARLSAAENAVKLSVQQAYIKARTADQRAVLLQTTILPQSRQTLDAARIGYESDRLDFLTVLENQRMLLTERLNYVRALADLAEARADLERAIGMSLEDMPAIVAAKARR
jgi:outer membrane protein TolC